MTAPLVLAAGLLLCGQVRAEPAAVTFETDPRVELLAVVALLADGPPAPRRAGAASSKYAEDARAVFSPFAGHRAVELLQKILKQGNRIAPAQLLLSCSAPPELAAVRPGQEEFLRELRDFSRRSRFPRFYEKNSAHYAALAQAARDEAARGLRPEAVSLYLRRPGPVRLRFLISDLLPWELAANEGDASIRSAVNRTFSFDGFGTGPAHEAASRLLAPLAQKHRPELEVYSGLMPAGCADSWLGCVMEHVNVAVTLRALAAERGEGEYESLLAQQRNLPFLEALAQRLKEWEATPDARFEAFYPRLVAVFREALLKETAERARAATAPPEKPKDPLPLRDIPPPQLETVPSPRIETRIIDPRLELASALIGLAVPRSPTGPFAAHAGHPAVLRVRRMLRKADQRALPAQLMLYVSTPPALALTGPVPAGAEALAGGPEELEKFYEDARDFAVKTGFSRYYRSRGESYRAAARRRSRLIETFSPAMGRPVVSSLLPPGYWVRLVRIPRASAAEVWTLMSEDLLKESAARTPALEIRLRPDPRVELLSVLRLLGRRGAAGGGAASPYRRDAELWFSSFSTHPAVSQTAALLERAPRANLPQQIMLHLSEPPDLYARDPIPSGYIDEAGGDEVVAAFIEAAGDFSRAARFEGFLAKHRDDYRAFSAQAENEALSSISPEAVRAYLGAPLSSRYSFPLAPLLAQSDAANFSLQRHDRVEEVRLRPSRFSSGPGHRFLFDQFGTSVAHELAHIVLNPLVDGFDAKGAKPPSGCNDQTEGSWTGCIQEHLVYAVTLRILALDLGEPAYEQMLRDYSLRGFPYLGPLGERLKEYEAQRGRYKTLGDFYPRLKTVFIEALPKDTPVAAPPEDPRSRRLKDQGVKAFMEARYDEALVNFKDAAAQEPRDAEAFLNLGVVYEKLGEKEKALESYDSAVSFSGVAAPRERDLRVAALSSRATLLFALGRAAEAREDLKRVLSIAPSDWEGRLDVEKRLTHD